MSDFIPGLKLGEGFYHEAVKPILEADFPDLKHAAALIGSGSEILGFDTPMSSDHHWGPRVMLFVSQDDYARHADSIRDGLSHKLPYTFRGYPTHFTSPDPNDSGTQLLEMIDAGPIHHRVEVFTLRDFFIGYLDFDIADDLTPADWLTFPQQRLRTIVSGAVYHDDIGLNAIRAKFTYYPQDVWLYLLAAGWTRIGQEEPFVGRTGYVGDDLGSQIIAARLCRDAMHLCFLMERQYAPYSKWFGTAFAQLKCAASLTPLLRWTMLAQSWREREQSITQVYEMLAAMHNALQITPPMPTKVSPFHGRPFKVIHGEAFAAAIKAQIQDEAVKRISIDIGGIDQFSDSTDVLSNPALRRRLKTLYS
jgi:hypothetical protein